MTPREARKKLDCISTHYLCPVCLIPQLFCDQHSRAERDYALTALKDVATRRSTQKRRRKTRKRS